MGRVKVWNIRTDYFEGITGYVYFHLEKSQTKYPEAEWVEFLLADDDFGAVYKGRVHPDLYEELFDWGAGHFGTTILFVKKKDDPQYACGNYAIGPRPSKDELPRVFKTEKGPWGMVIG